MKGYDFASMLSLHKGTGETSYEYLGVHREDADYVFRVWAPRACTVYVVGDFNGWSEDHPMTRIGNGIWECYISSDKVCDGSLYKYKIKNGEKELYKADPYSFRVGVAPETASIVADISGYLWRDSGWLEYRRKKEIEVYNKPINIYELDPMLWRYHDQKKPYLWRELATELATYVKQMGYTHIRLARAKIPVSSCYAPLAEMGEPKDFMGFVDSMHEAGVGVILDWISDSFSDDEHSLGMFDGQPLYEREREIETNINSGTKSFDILRPEIKSFLISNALFWLDLYHIDGLCVDWEIDPCEKNAFYRELESIIKKHFPDVLVSDFKETCLPEVSEINCLEQNIAVKKLLLGYKMTFPCKKILSMGEEIGQRQTADLSYVDWCLLDKEDNAKLQYYVAELNHFYLRSSPLWDKSVFEWIDDDISKGVISYRRTASDGQELITILNFNNEVIEEYRVGVLKKGYYKDIFNSDEFRFGGLGLVDHSKIRSEDIPYKQTQASIIVKLAPLSVTVVRYEE